MKILMLYSILSVIFLGKLSANNDCENDFNVICMYPGNTLYINAYKESRGIYRDINTYQWQKFNYESSQWEDIESDTWIDEDYKQITLLGKNSLKTELYRVKLEVENEIISEKSFHVKYYPIPCNDNCPSVVSTDGARVQSAPLCIEDIYFDCLRDIPEPAINPGIYALLDNDIYKVDEANAQLSLFIGTDLPSNKTNYQLTYNPDNQKFYSLLNHASNPELAEISLDGTHKIIGNVEYQGSNLKLVEGMSYNIDDNTLYVGASLNGDFSTGDYNSESLLSIDINTAECKFVANPSSAGALYEDYDDIVFHQNQFYSMDTQPGNLNYTKIFLFNDSYNSQLVFDYSPYLPTSLLVFNSNNESFILAQRILYKISFNGDIANKIGDTHSSAEYNGAIIRGVAYVY